MSELALFLVRTGFLVMLWIFIFSIISVIRADLFGQKVVSRVAQANVPAVFSSPGVAGAAPTQQLEQKRLVSDWPARCSQLVFAQLAENFPPAHRRLQHAAR